MLGRLEMDVDECIEAYSGLAEAVFAEKRCQFPANLKGNIRPRFDSTKLQNAIEAVLLRKDVRSTDLLNDGQARRCRAYVFPGLGFSSSSCLD